VTEKENSWVDVELKRLDLEFQKWMFNEKCKMDAEKNKLELIEAIVIPVLAQIRSLLDRIEISTKKKE